MGRREHRKKLARPWRNIHGAIWLIGLAVLAWGDWWWPGILILIALSSLIEAVLMQKVPNAFEDEEAPTVPPSQTPAATRMPVSPAATAQEEHHAQLLPTNCPRCGGPIRGQEVVWTGSQSADCPYCGANLPMKKGQY
jgi:hypothetical protein